MNKQNFWLYFDKKKGFLFGFYSGACIIAYSSSVINNNNIKLNFDICI